MKSGSVIREEIVVGVTSLGSVTEGVVGFGDDSSCWGRFSGKAAV